MVKIFFVRLIRVTLLLIFIATLCVAGGAWWVYDKVVNDSGEEIKLSRIQRILGRESHVYFSDGKTPLGVFFDTDHRKYVKYKDIPKAFVNALVASEDNRYFKHWGFDPESIARAAFKNFQAGRIVQGGSTITQQTAKNLFKRKDRSYEAKLKELFIALKLEHVYTKEQIFEFYANQFYVSGNGVGLGIAARYYFNKEPKDLDLVECAFIAGSVKRPNFYNPFRKKDEEGRRIARRRAQKRLAYVLGEMHKLGMIDQQTYQKAVSTPIGFNQGKVGYDALDYTMDLVRDAVSSDEVLNALTEHGIDNIATSGVRVITTVDHVMQLEAMAALRTHLGKIDIMLRGYTRNEIQSELQTLEYGGDVSLEKNAFLFGTVTNIRGRGGEIAIDVKLDKNLGYGTIHERGLKDMAAGLAIFRQKNRYAKVSTDDIVRLAGQIKKGDRVWVKVVESGVFASKIFPAKLKAKHSILPAPVRLGREKDKDAVNRNQIKPAELALVKYPRVQGGAIVVKDGRIIAMAGGTENRFFNRAFHARRTMGSAFKPLVYTAAIQFGWDSTDELYNERTFHVYQGIPYFPRPDHRNANNWVSMSWAGVRSENLATIWLLAHLCDKLTPFQFREVAEYVGLTPQSIDGKPESYEHYRRRIRDKVGIHINKEILQEAAYKTALRGLEADFAFDGMMESYQTLSNMPYGRNFSKYREELREEQKKVKTAKERRELEERQGLINRSYLGVLSGYQRFAAFRLKVTTELARELFFEDHIPIEGPLYRRIADGRFFYFPFGGNVSGMEPFSGRELMDYLDFMEENDREFFWENVVIDKVAKVSALKKIHIQQKAEYERLSAHRPYDYAILQNVDDFRTAVGLYYLIRLGRALGISSTLKPVLSFPLGSNVVTPFEMTRAYEALVTGKLVTYWPNDQDVPSAKDLPDRYTGEYKGGKDATQNYFADESSDALAVIDRIESEDGEVIYRPKRQEKRVVDERVSLEISSILANVINYGTGRYAQNVFYKALIEGKDVKIKIPLLGKTGTANEYTNASFFGYLPGVGPDGGTTMLQGGYAVGVYSGYDNNISMKLGRGIRVSGSVGALPIWSEIVQSLLEQEAYKENINTSTLEKRQLQLMWPDFGHTNIKVYEQGGGIMQVPVRAAKEEEPAIRSVGEFDESGNFIPIRKFMPFWRSASNK